MKSKHFAPVLGLVILASSAVAQAGNSVTINATYNGVTTTETSSGPFPGMGALGGEEEFWYGESSYLAEEVMTRVIPNPPLNQQVYVTYTGTAVYNGTTYNVTGNELIIAEKCADQGGCDYGSPSATVGWVSRDPQSLNFTAAPKTPLTTTLSPFTLNAGQCKLASGMALCMQSDGNLVLYKANAAGTAPNYAIPAVWATSFYPTYDWIGFSGPTMAQSCAGCMAAFQADGNLVLYRGPYTAPYWASRSDPFSGAKLVITQTTLMIVNSAGQQIWN